MCAYPLLLVPFPHKFNTASLNHLLNACHSLTMLLFLLYYINTATVNSLSNGFSNLTRPEMSQEEHFVGDDTTFVFMSAS